MMHYQKNIKLIVLAYLLVCSSSFAGVLDNLKRVVPDYGVESDVTDPGASYFHGGSYQMKTPVKTLQPFRFDPPSLIGNGNCGISLFNGGFGLVSAKEKALNYLKNISFVSSSYPFILGLQALGPKVKDIMSQINALRDKARQLSANTNNLGARLVGGKVSQNESHKQLENEFLSDGVQA